MEDDQVQWVIDALRGWDVYGNCDVDIGGVEASGTLDVEELSGSSIGGAVLQSWWFFMSRWLFPSCFVEGCRTMVFVWFFVREIFAS